jgi:glycosyltransferase involved in cell wall biosynthesis
MKILLINNDRKWSGGQEHLNDLAGELLKRGVEVQFVVREGSVSDSRFREHGVPVHPLPGHGFQDLAALFKLVRLLRRERFDVVSINREHDLLLTALAWQIAFPLGKRGRLMMSYHTATKRRQPFIGSADAVVCISEHVRSSLLHGNPRIADKVRILYYGIKTPATPTDEKFDVRRRRRLFHGAGFPLIGMVGDLWKNQEELVGMIPEMKKAFPELKVAFIGDSSNRSLYERVAAKVRSEGVDESVIFTGRIPRDKIPDAFFDLDLSVTTHRNEGFGIVHLESLAAGTPVVAYNEGGFVDIFKGEEAGVLVDGGADDFASAVVGLLRDDARRFAMGRNGFDLVRRRYSVQAMGETYLDFYGALVRKDR